MAAPIANLSHTSATNEHRLLGRLVDRALPFGTRLLGGGFLSRLLQLLDRPTVFDQLSTQFQLGKDLARQAAQ